MKSNTCKSFNFLRFPNPSIDANLLSFSQSCSNWTRLPSPEIDAKALLRTYDRQTFFSENRSTTGLSPPPPIIPQWMSVSSVFADRESMSVDCCPTTTIQQINWEIMLSIMCTLRRVKFVRNSSPSIDVKRFLFNYLRKWMRDNETKELNTCNSFSCCNRLKFWTTLIWFAVHYATKKIYWISNSTWNKSTLTISSFRFNGKQAQSNDAKSLSFSCKQNKK